MYSIRIVTTIHSKKKEGGACATHSLRPLQLLFYKYVMLSKNMFYLELFTRDSLP